MSILFRDALIFQPSVLGNIYVEEMKNSEIYVETLESIQISSISFRVHQTDIRYPRMKADRNTPEGSAPDSTSPLNTQLRSYISNL